MIIPLAILAIGSVLAGMIWYGDFFGHHVKEFFGDAVYVGKDNHVLHDAHDVPKWVKVSPFIAMSLGLALAYIFYIAKPDTPRRLAASQPVLHQFLLNKWYFDEIYNFIFVRPTMWLGKTLWKRGDGSIIDGTINGIAMGIVPFMTGILGRWQSGYLFHYAFAMFLGLAAMITWFTVGG